MNRGNNLCFLKILAILLKQSLCSILIFTNVLVVIESIVSGTEVAVSDPASDLEPGETCKSSKFAFVSTSSPRHLMKHIND